MQNEVSIKCAELQKCYKCTYVPANDYIVKVIKCHYLQICFFFGHSFRMCIHRQVKGGMWEGWWRGGEGRGGKGRRGDGRRGEGWWSGVEERKGE